MLSLRFSLSNCYGKRSNGKALANGQLTEAVLPPALSSAGNVSCQVGPRSTL